MQATFTDLNFYNESCNNGGSQLSFEIDTSTASTKADIWVKIPALIAGLNQISVYYSNNTVVGSLSSGTNTFNVSAGGIYGGVWHQNAVNTTDSTGNNAKGTATGAAKINLNTTSAIVGTSLTYPGGAVYNDLGVAYYIALNNTYNYTIEMWVKMADTANALYFEQAQGSSSWNVALGTYTLDVAGNGIKHTYRSQADATRRSVNSGVLMNNTWQYVVATYTTGSSSGNNSNIYIDGQLKANNSIAGVTRSAALTKTELGYGGDYGSFTGAIDEVRISKTTASNDWINETYQTIFNQATFVKFNAEQGTPATLSCVYGSGITKVQYKVNTFDPFPQTINVSGQTSTVPLFNCTNTGGSSGTLQMLVNDTYSYTNYTYQENANQTTASGNLTDGDWTTGINYPIGCGAGNASYMNYTIPTGTTNVLWQVKDQWYGIQNITIPLSCRKTNKLILGFDHYMMVDEDNVYTYACYDTDALLWSFLAMSDPTCGGLRYEEAIYWDYSYHVNDICGITNIPDITINTSYSTFSTLTAGNSTGIWCNRNYSALPTTKKPMTYTIQLI
jgi:hypothetical protein